MGIFSFTNKTFNELASSIYKMLYFKGSPLGEWVFD